MGAPRQTGELQHVVTILRASPMRSEFGEDVLQWGEFTRLFAKREDGIPGREDLVADELAAHQAQRFWIRWSSLTSTITPRDRLRHDGTDYAITAVDDYGRREWRTIDAVCRSDGAPDTQEGETA